jgi:peptide subunit release factor RF-3
MDRRRDLGEEVFELAREGCKPFDLEAFREGHLTPVIFGSALRELGVRDLIERAGRWRRARGRSRPTSGRSRRTSRR